MTVSVNIFEYVHDRLHKMCKIPIAFIEDMKRAHRNLIGNTKCKIAYGSTRRT